MDLSNHHDQFSTQSQLTPAALACWAAAEPASPVNPAWRARAFVAILALNMLLWGAGIAAALAK